MDPVTICVTFAVAAFSPFLKVLLDRALAYAEKKISSGRAVKDELKRLHGTLLKIRATLSDVEMRRVDGRSLTIWLSELKDAAYDIDDVLDEFALEVRRQHPAAESRINDNALEKVAINSKLADKIKATRQRLEMIAKERQDLQLGEPAPAPAPMMAGGSLGRQNTSSFAVQTGVFGREEDKANVIRMLLRSGSDGARPHSNQDVAILPIVGMGGVGKTTLAQLVYNDEEVEKYFHLRMWVCVSQNFDLMRLAREILESTSAGATCDLTNLNMLQWLLRRKLAARRFLLVLDDVWDADHGEWDSLIAPLLCGAGGSRVLVTTRNRDIGRLAGTMDAYFLEVLPMNACWLLFKQCAFRSGNSDRYPKLEAIGKEIVTKLRGSPLAAKTLGRLLNSALEERVWRDFLDSEIWELQQDDSDILPVLRLSYQHLPENLKQCFSFCCVFPKNQRFQIVPLVQIWLAEGFIQPQGRRRLEDIGRDYFDYMFSKCLFQVSGKDEYVMHDLIHDLARSISMDECFTTEDGKSHKMPKKVRHLSLTSTSDSDSLQSLLHHASRFGSLRTLLLSHVTRTSDIFSGLDQLFKTSRRLRVLALSGCSIRELPDSICSLVHLRYLDVSNTSLRSLPDCLGDLCNLQTIKLLGCPMLGELPRSVSNLTNLRHLEADRRLTSCIGHIGRLTSLQELEEYKILRSDGYRVGELKCMTEIRGSLSIQNLENVDDGEDASILRNKMHLDTVELAWKHTHVDPRTTDLDLKVLEGLAPHANISGLVINGYGGHRSPRWMAGSIDLSNLESVHVRTCRNWEFLPAFGQLQFLKSLKIEEMYAVKEVTQEFCGSGDAKGFPSLKMLHLSDMPNWEQWSAPEGTQPFPLLSELVLKNCPQLRELPLLPPGLTKLQIENVGLDALPGIWGLDTILAEQGGSLPLSSVSISDCHNLASLHEGLLQHELTALKKLTLYGCEELISLPRRWFGGLASLNSLEVVDCPQLIRCEGGLPSSLLTLEISRSSHVLIEGLVMAPQNLASCNFYVENECRDLGCCVLKVLQHLNSTLQRSFISYFDDPSAWHSPSDGVSLSYEPSTREMRLDVRCFNHLPDSSHSSLLACLPMLGSISFLSLEGFSTLEILPGDVLRHLASLQEMKISSCEELRLLGIQALTSLQRLTVEDCPNLTVLPAEGPQQLPLEFLEINNSVLFTASLQNLTSLRHLIIRNCDELETFTIQEEEWLSSLCSLQKLHIVNCARLRSMPADLQSLHLLHNLKIQNCPNIRPGHRLPSSLTNLVIWMCPLLEQCVAPGSTHWPQFSGIPRIFVNDRLIQIRP